MAEEYRDTLYTIDKSGRRKWVYPTLIRGFWHTRRVVIAYLLMAFYLLMPWITINGQQGILLDFVNRKFVFFGTIFWATDTLYLVFVLVLAALSLFFFTAIFGRVWCGWACPETVFLEFLFRPIEHLVEGSGAQRLRLDRQPWNARKVRIKATKHLLCAFFSWVLASTALAYVIGRDPLLAMMVSSPMEHLVPFSLTLVLMGLMAFQFGWFREQFCTVVCPYARFQSVLLDVNSLIVGYDSDRGEPRGKLNKNSPQELGDCVNCGLCVRVCPTGIDIRNGTQLECIHCAACIDACDSIMDKVGRPQGLIRYDTQAGFSDGSQKFLRPRIIVYALLIFTVLSAFVFALSTREVTEFQLLRVSKDRLFTLSGTTITNHVEARIANKGDSVKEYRFAVVGDEIVSLVTPFVPFQVQPGAVATTPLFLSLDREHLDVGEYEVSIVISDGDTLALTQKITLIGPEK